MASTKIKTDNVWTEYNGKKFAAEYAEYSERASKDVEGNPLTLNVEDGKVTKIGDKSIAATSAAQDASGNVITTTYATKVELAEATQDMQGATAQSAGTAGLVPAPAAGDQESILKGDGTWTALENDVVGTQLLGENGQPMLDETTQEPIYDAYSTDQLWTGFAGKKFGAARAVADQDGNVFGDTYATKHELANALGDIETLLAAI